MQSKWYLSPGPYTGHIHGTRVDRSKAISYYKFEASCYFKVWQPRFDFDAAQGNTLEIPGSSDILP